MGSARVSRRHQFNLMVAGQNGMLLFQRNVKWITDLKRMRAKNPKADLDWLAPSATMRTQTAEMKRQENLRGSTA